MEKILLVIDSFKGSLSSFEAEQAAAQGIRDVLPDCETLCIPIADGGEGMMDVLVSVTGGKLVEARVHDALMRPVLAHYGVLGDNQTVVIEMAQACGLPLLREDERNPLKTTTFGVGELLAQAMLEGYKNIIMGIGGSATNDGGMGLMQALGARFFDSAGKDLPTGCGDLLKDVTHVDLEEFNKKIKGVEIVVACDVSNPLCGRNGAAHIFAPQKGATPEMVVFLEEGMQHYSILLRKIAGTDVAQKRGAGAAGGLGACLFTFFHAALRPGISLMIEQIGLRKKMEGATMVFTGEGKADRQTLMGKVPAGVLKMGKAVGTDVVLLAGALEDTNILQTAGFSELLAVTPEGMPLDRAMLPHVAAANIRNTVADFLRRKFK